MVMEFKTVKVMEFKTVINLEAKRKSTRVKNTTLSRNSSRFFSSTAITKYVNEFLSAQKSVVFMHKQKPNNIGWDKTSGIDIDPHDIPGSEDGDEGDHSVLIMDKHRKYILSKHFERLSFLQLIESFASKSVPGTMPKEKTRTKTALWTRLLDRMTNTPKECLEPRTRLSIAFRFGAEWLWNPSLPSPLPVHVCFLTLFTSKIVVYYLYFAVLSSIKYVL